jgi:hypothetical protein
MKWTRMVLAWLFIALCADRAIAWNSTGHMAVALLAWKRLDRDQREAAHQILMAHPHYKRYLAADRPENVAEEEWVFLRAATWPDWVRETPQHHASDLKPFHHATWHYINLPFVPPTESNEFSPAELQPPSPNVVTALDDAFVALTARRATAEEQAISFCWVLHLVGDIHQPLHCAALVSQRYPPPHGDDGGNRLAITPHKRPGPLHSYWDDLLGRNNHLRALEAVAKRADTEAEGNGDLAERLRDHNTARSWADESFATAVKFAYLDGRLPAVDYQEVERGTIPHSEVPILPASYGETAREVARQQAALAGQRLAAMVQQIVSGNSR